MSDSDPVIDIFNLSKKYGEFTALDSLTLQVGKGQILGFIGPNGAGKTTTIKILVGLLKPTHGRATIEGADCFQQAKKIKRLVGYMPDIFGAYENMRVNEYLDFFGAAYGIGRSKRKNRIQEVLEIAGASDMRDLFVSTLSRGMQQRIALARTMIHDPQVLILDEPASGLDPQARIDMRGMLLRLSELGKTLIVTSHILPELARVCDLVAMITHGKLRAFGSLQEIMSSIHQRRTFEVMLLSEEHVDSVAATTQTWLDNHQTHVSADGPDVLRQHAECVVRLTTTLNDQEISPLLTHLIHAGSTIVQFREVVTNLEDAFLSVAADGQKKDQIASRQANGDTEVLSNAGEQPH